MVFCIALLPSWSPMRWMFYWTFCSSQIIVYSRTRRRYHIWWLRLLLLSVATVDTTHTGMCLQPLIPSVIQDLCAYSSPRKAVMIYLLWYSLFGSISAWVFPVFPLDMTFTSLTILHVDSELFRWLYSTIRLWNIPISIATYGSSLPLSFVAMSPLMS